MKQPKFRGFNLETNSWHYGHGWFEIDYTEEFLKEKGIQPQAMLHTEGYPVECDLSSMGQYTGTKIKGKELYDGDIVKVNKLTFEASSPLPENLNVRFYGGMFQFFRGKECLMGLHLSYLEDGEVIGNVYQNPELINA